MLLGCKLPSDPFKHWSWPQDGERVEKNGSGVLPLRVEASQGMTKFCYRPIVWYFFYACTQVVVWYRGVLVESLQYAFTRQPP